MVLNEQEQGPGKHFNRCFNDEIFKICLIPCDCSSIVDSSHFIRQTHTQRNALQLVTTAECYGTGNVGVHFTVPVKL